MEDGDTNVEDQVEDALLSLTSALRRAALCEVRPHIVSALFATALALLLVAAAWAFHTN